ncbi:hypothetical protein AB9Q10_16300 [Streptomyces krungchingensis]
MLASLLADLAIAAVIVAWTFLATVRWARFESTPRRPLPSWAHTDQERR